MRPAIREWIESRPPKVREAALAYPPDQYYRMRSTGQIVWLVSYYEPSNDGPVTVKVYVLPGYNLHNPGVHVFGIALADLERLD